MLRCKSELFQSSIKLVDLLKYSTKEHLKEMSGMVRLPIPTKLRKDEYAAYFAEAILCAPDMWLRQLTHYELELLDRLVKAGPNSSIEALHPLMPTMLEDLSFILTDNHHIENGKVRYMICDELREAIAPYLNEYLTSGKQSVRSMILQYTLGIINLYGFLSYQDLYALLAFFLKDEVTKREITNAIATSALMQRFTFDTVDDYNSTINIQSLYVQDLERLLIKIYDEPIFPERKLFSKKEVFAAGSLPNPVIPNPCSDKMRHLLISKLGQTKEAAEYNLLRIWFEAQTEEREKKLLSTFSSIIEKEFTSFEEAQEAMKVVSDYLSHCPRWSLQGYSVLETSVFLKMEEERKKPAPTSAGWDMLPTYKNVGRNDLCPCGSGKKYKKCCGKDK